MGVARFWRVPVIKARMENEEDPKNVTELTPNRVGTVEMVLLG